MTTEELCTLLSSVCQAFAPTGSRVICDPAPTDTDEDYVCLAGTETYSALQAAGFVTAADFEQYAEMPDFVAYRLEHFNVIVTDNADFYSRFVAATDEAKQLNLTIKIERIALFQRVLYGNDMGVASATAEGGS